MNRRAGALTAVLTALVAAAVPGCSSTPPALSLTVLAAASLQPTFTELGDQFRAEHPGTSVRFDFASSSDLAAQLTQGATGDVFASADTTQMDTVAAAGLLAGARSNSPPTRW
ncbi:Molybdate-binding protein [Mycobacterium talmoniae]|uniref:Molybdate-binding protein n=1 Tax=Mycobacterium talmoniae TaxID=1858794 RepID=A0A2S8BPT7_9MYCO|nr:Molybdate-binding protein [Mycobacterium talmoniae]